MAHFALKLFDMKTFQTLSSTGMLTSMFREVRNGNNLFSSGSDRSLTDKPRPHDGNASPEKQIGQLTSREREVLQLIAEGNANKETASELCISIKTVEKHRGNLMEKLGIHGTARLTRYAIAVGIVQCNF
jgi:DNA-binding NarL/FixJ family response regulator